MRGSIFQTFRKEVKMKEFEIIKFEDGNNEFELKVLPDVQTIWFTQNQMALFYDKSLTSISRYIKNIFSKDELEKMTYFQKSQISNHRPTTLYNLDVVLAIGHQIKSKKVNLLMEFANNYFDYKKDNNSQLIIYNNGQLEIPLKVVPKEDTIWATASVIAVIFETTERNVNMHIHNLYKDGEIENPVGKKSFLTELDTEKTLCSQREILKLAKDGKQYLTKEYNLDVILAVGYRVKTKNAIMFRKWATKTLKEIMLYGYSINDNKCIECKNSMLNLNQRLYALEQISKNSITYFPGDVLRGFIEIKRFLETAKHEILIVDNYFGHEFDEVLSNINVEKTIITDPNNKKIETCENYTVIKTKLSHDRYILVDDVCYHFGQSPKDLGEAISTGHLFTDEKVIELYKTIKNKEGG